MQNNGFHFDQSNQSFKISSVQVWLKAVPFELFQLQVSIFQEIHSLKMIKSEVSSKCEAMHLTFRGMILVQSCYEGGQVYGGICMLLPYLLCAFLLEIFDHVPESQFGSTFRQVKCAVIYMRLKTY